MLAVLFMRVTLLRNILIVMELSRKRVVSQTMKVEDLCVLIISEMGICNVNGSKVCKAEKPMSWNILAG